MEDTKDVANVITNKNSLIIFGRDVAKIPCFRQSWLYGIYSGFGCGILTFMFTSRVHLASHVTLGTTFGITLVYFTVCRYQYYKDEMMALRLKMLMKESMALEGSDHQNKVTEIENMTKTK